MKITPTAIPDVLVIEPQVFGDARGFFFESFNAREFKRLTGIDPPIMQDNHSRSVKNVLRGLHYQIVQPQGKLARVVAGEIFDVAVDIRRASPSYGRYISAVLSAENWHQLWVPVGFAHGFCTIEPDTEVVYKTTNYYDRNSERVVKWNDPDLAIPWPVAEAEVQLSEKDQAAQGWADMPVWFRA